MVAAVWFIFECLVNNGQILADGGEGGDGGVGLTCGACGDGELGQLLLEFLQGLPGSSGLPGQIVLINVKKGTFETP